MTGAPRPPEGLAPVFLEPRQPEPRCRNLTGPAELLTPLLDALRRALDPGGRGPGDTQRDYTLAAPGDD